MSAALIRHTGLDGADDPAVSHPSGFCAGTVFETDRGAVDVAALRAGDALRCVSGEFVAVSRVLTFDGVSDWVGLPGRDGEVAVAAGQLVLCRHFLVGGLFGAVEAEFPADYIIGPGVRRSDGSRRTLHVPVVAVEAVLGVGGYEFPFLRLRSVATVPAEGRAGEERLAMGSRGPHPGQPLQELSSPSRVLLTPAQVHQLCDAGVLLRGAGR